MKPQVLFLFGSQACVPEDPLLAARRLGCTTAVFSARLPCGLTNEQVDRYETVPLQRPEEVLAAALTLHADQPVAAVLAYDDEAVPMAARVAADLGLPGHPLAAADASRDKVEMKQRFVAAGVPVARHILADDEDDAVRWASSNGYPVVVKPVRGSASQGVIRADSADELRQGYRRLRRIVREKGLDTGGRGDAAQLVEEYLDGVEVSVELLIQGGEPRVLCIFDKPRPLVGPFFEESIYTTPTTLPASRRRAVEELACRAAVALGLRDGVGHCEIRLSNGGLRVLELGARLIGGACSRVFRHVFEEDIHSCVLRIALGERLALPRLKTGAAGAMMLPVPAAGRLRQVRGVAEARAVPGIADVIVNAEAGQIILPFPEQRCYVGFLTAAASEPSEVEAVLATAAAHVELELEPLVCEVLRRGLCADDAFSPPGRYRIERFEDHLPDAVREALVLPALARSCFGDLPGELAAQEARRCADRLLAAAEGDGETAVWAVAEEGGVAFAAVRGDACRVSCLGVIPGRRREGIGEALLRELIALAAGRRCTSLELEVDPTNEGAVELYRRLGFHGAAVANGCGCCAC